MKTYKFFKAGYTCSIMSLNTLRRKAQCFDLKQTFEKDTTQPTKTQAELSTVYDKQNKKEVYKNEIPFVCLKIS
jgi:hypothetical protein